MAAATTTAEPSSRRVSDVVIKAFGGFVKFRLDYYIASNTLTSADSPGRAEETPQDRRLGGLRT